MSFYPPNKGMNYINLDIQDLFENFSFQGWGIMQQPIRMT